MPEERVKNNIEALLRVAEEARARLDAETSVVALAENDGLNVYYAASVGKHAERLTDRRAPAATSGLCGVAFQGREAVLVCTTAGDLRVRQDHAQELGIETALAVPMFEEGRLLGALMVLNRLDGQLFDELSEQTLQRYAEEAAPVVAQYRVE